MEIKDKPILRKEDEQTLGDYLNIVEEKGYLPILVEKMKEKKLIRERKNENLRLISVVLISMLFGAILLYAVLNDSFKSEISQDVTLTPNITVNADPIVNNQYDVGFEPINEYNYTINNYITLEDCSP